MTPMTEDQAYEAFIVARDARQARSAEAASAIARLLAAGREEEEAKVQWLERRDRAKSS